ncbi:Rpn family recombination-promoting nuclease/putative transposase [Lysinibacillus sp. FSL H8-0500]|uniref:Rpn family recombination-promoting nuclease/putative transposase n=1 Tax=Lysinibacillus sp. FSL H8-0500 TaxID=2921393 RepID=UPI003100B27B
MESKRQKEQAKEFPIIIPLVFYHGKQIWSLPTSLGPLLDGYEELPEDVKKYVPNFDYLLYDLSHYSNKDIQGTVPLRMMLTLLRDIFTKDIEIFTHTLRHLQEADGGQWITSYVETILIYIL